MCLFKQKTAYEMRISDWSSDVCSSDLAKAYCMALETAEGEARAAVAALAVHACVANKGDALLGIAARCAARASLLQHKELGRASCRERVCQYLSISVVAVSLKKHQSRHKQQYP